MSATRPLIEQLPPRPADARSPLKQHDWRYVENTRLDELTPDEWQLMNHQRSQYLLDEKPRQAVEMLLAQRSVPVFGYQVNNFEHCMQSATRALHDGRDADTIVVALFHDIGFTVCNETHGNFAAELLRPYVAARHVWTLQRHMHFQAVYCPDAPGVDARIIERWRGHDWFEWADEFVRLYDIDAVDPEFQAAPLSEFLPLVQQVFQRPERPFIPD